MTIVYVTNKELKRKRFGMCPKKAEVILRNKRWIDLDENWICNGGTYTANNYIGKL